MGLACGRLGEAERFDRVGRPLLEEDRLSALGRFQVLLRRYRLGLAPDPRVDLGGDPPGVPAAALPTSTTHRLDAGGAE